MKSDYIHPKSLNNNLQHYFIPKFGRHLIYWINQSLIMEIMGEVLVRFGMYWVADVASLIVRWFTVAGTVFENGLGYCGPSD